jgi:hypothetical protein
LRARIEKVTLPVFVLVALADMTTDVALVLDLMVVPGGKFEQTITLPTSAVTKLAVGEVSAAELSVVEPSAKVTPPISHGGAARPETMPRPINFPTVAALAMHSSSCTQLKLRQPSQYQFNPF